MEGGAPWGRWGLEVLDESDTSRADMVRETCGGFSGPPPRQLLTLKQSRLLHSLSRPQLVRSLLSLKTIYLCAQLRLRVGAATGAWVELPRR